MTKREYLKYNNQGVTDMLNVPINIGDIVVINNNYRSFPIIGKVTHFTSSDRVAIRYTWADYLGSTCIGHFYRLPKNVIKIRDGNESRDKDKTEGKS